IVFDGAIEYLEKHKNSDQPFFMYVASAMPHTWVDYQIPPEDVEKFKNNPEINDFDAEIYAMIERLDNNLGRLLKKVDSLGLADDTIVIYTSDNGPQFAPTSTRWNMNLRGSKGSTYEGGIKLPCFIRWPNVLAADKDIKQVGACIDFMPTVLDMCGIDAELPEKIDGISLWPYINGTKTDKKPRTFYGQFHRSDVPCVWPNSYIREGDYKLVNGCELYNLAEDPYEKNDLSRQMPGKFYKLCDKYEKWFKNVTADVVDFGEFQINPIIVGSDKQQLTNLRYSNENPKYGWPMVVVDKGPYRITVNHMQNDLFDDTSVFELSVGERVLSKKILPNDGKLVFDNVTIEPGKYDFKAGIKGTYRTRVYRSGPDVGHRNIYIEKISR
ncbi:MAG: sulfatase-like hydrolase/transferase, partial [Sedimentisphaeraceae bacterium JB056]